MNNVVKRYIRLESGINEYLRFVERYGLPAFEQKKNLISMLNTYSYGN